MAAVTGFADIPPIGLGLAGKHQRYDLVAIEGHTRRDGSPTKLARWRSDCMTCGEPFEFLCPALALPESRRCSAHAQPGRRVAAR